MGLIFRRDIVVRSLRVAALVGTILVLINHGEALFAGQLTTAIAVRILLTYCVPYAVATYAGVRATLAAGQPGSGPAGTGRPIVEDNESRHASQ